MIEDKERLISDIELQLEVDDMIIWDTKVDKLGEISGKEYLILHIDNTIISCNEYNDIIRVAEMFFKQVTDYNINMYPIEEKGWIISFEGIEF